MATADIYSRLRFTLSFYSYSCQRLDRVALHGTVCVSHSKQIVVSPLYCIKHAIIDYLELEITHRDH